MIQSIEIKNFRGIREGKLEELTPLVVLVGPNSSGKSTILDALLIAAGRQPGNAIGRVVKRRAVTGRGARWLVWRASENGSAEVIARAADYQRAVKLTVPPFDPGQGVNVNVNCVHTIGAIVQQTTQSVHVDAKNHHDPTNESELAGFPPVHLVEPGDNSQPRYVSIAVRQNRELDLVSISRAISVCSRHNSIAT